MAKRKNNGEGGLFKVGQVYYLQYTVNGKRRKKSLKTGDEREAKKNAQEMLHNYFKVCYLP